jgi:hypothetical protein
MNEPEFVRATRAAYDAVAADYAARFRGELEAFPMDRALLAGFAELVRAAGGAPIADIGCGAGAVTAYLQRHPDQVADALGRAGLTVRPRATRARRGRRIP